MVKNIKHVNKTGNEQTLLEKQHQQTFSMQDCQKPL